jgi:hypothetical protein
MSLAMTKLKDIEKAIARLPAKDVAKLRAWLEAFEGRLLDQRIAQDEKPGRDGKLAKLAAKALADHKAGRSRQL